MRRLPAVKKGVSYCRDGNVYGRQWTVDTPIRARQGNRQPANFGFYALAYVQQARDLSKTLTCPSSPDRV